MNGLGSVNDYSVRHAIRTLGINLTRTAPMSSACITNSPPTLGLYATSEGVQSRGRPDIQRHLSPKHVAGRGICDLSSRSALTTKTQRDGKGLSFPTNQELVLRETPFDTQIQGTTTVPVNAAEKITLHSARSEVLDRETDFKACRDSLEKAFRMCEQDSFSHICCALSLLLSSLRPLKQVELCAAVSLVVHWRQQFMVRPKADPTDVLLSTDRYLDLADAVVVNDESGHVLFRNKRMEEFLHTFWIRGIDASHKTISGACLAQIEMDKIDASNRAVPDEFSSVYKNSAFSDYASQHEQEHFRRAQMPIRLQRQPHEQNG